MSETKSTPSPDLVGTARTLTRGSLLRSFNLFAAIAISLVLMPYVVRILGDRMYGLWILVGTFAGYSGLLDLGLSSAVTRYLAAAIGSKRQEEARRIFSTALFIYLLVFAAVLVLGIAAAAVAPRLVPPGADMGLLFGLIIVCSFSAALNFPLRVFVGALEAGLRFDRTATLELASAVLRTVLVVAFLAGGSSVLGLAWATLTSVVVSLCLHIWYTRRDLPFLAFARRQVSFGAARQLFSFSTFSFIIQVADLLRFQVAAVVVGSYLGLAPVTHYRVATAMATYFVNLMTAALGLLLPVFSQRSAANDAEGIRKVFFFATKVSIALSSFIGFGLIAWGRPFISRWMGVAYDDAYPCLILLTVGYLFALWQLPSVSLLYGLAKHRVFALITIAEGIANLVLSLAFVRRYGLVGVAMGTLIPAAISKLLLQPVYVCRVAGIPVGIYLRRGALAVLAAALSLLLPLAISAGLAQPEYFRLTLVALSSALLYAPVVWMVLFTHSEREMLLRVVRGHRAWPATSVVSR